MKKLFSIAVCLFFLLSLANAQNTKGSILIGTTTDIAGGFYNDYLTGTGNAAGWSFITSFSKSGSSTSDKIKERAFNLSPRIGYLM